MRESLASSGLSDRVIVPPDEVRVGVACYLPTLCCSGRIRTPAQAVASARLVEAIRGIRAAIYAGVLLCVIGRGLEAQGTVADDSLVSLALGTQKPLKIYLPPSYHRDGTRRFPTLYYLHGIWGNEANWVGPGGLAVIADSLAALGRPEIILVMPDGDDGFYRTWVHPLARDTCTTARPQPLNQAEAPEAYCVEHQRYDAYIVEDLVAHVDARYRTLAGARHRAVAGVSMGGYGAITLTLRYPEVFGAAASHSGILSLLLRDLSSSSPPPRYATSSDELRSATGRLWPLLSRVFGYSIAGWLEGDPTHQVAALRRAGRPIPPLFLDVGESDPFGDQTRAFHAELEALGIAHSYAEWPGNHDWTYWRAHVGESLSWLIERVQP